MEYEEVIKKLNLEPLPVEGGYFRRFYESEFLHSDQRPHASAIHYLVTRQSFSSLHRLKTAEEIFIFCAGDPVEQIQLSHHGIEHYRMGTKLQSNHRTQVVVPANRWQGTKLVSGGTWALLCTIVVPAYLPQDCEFANREELISLFPKHEKVIKDFTYES